MKRQADGQLNLIALDNNQAAPQPVQQSTAPGNGCPMVRKRDGTFEPFNQARIALAIESAFKAVRDIPADAPMTGVLPETVRGLAEKIAKRLTEEFAQGTPLEIERIQDAVENQLMLDGFLTEARRFILYREDRRKIREQKAESAKQLPPKPATIHIIRNDGRQEQFDPERIRRRLVEAAHGLEGCELESLVRDVTSFVSNGTTTAEISEVLLATVKSRRKQSASYHKLATRLVLKRIYAEVIPDICPADEFAAVHQLSFRQAIEASVDCCQLSPELLGFDFGRLTAALKLERDELMASDGLRWLYENCFARNGQRRLETPQFFWMRIAMALALNECDQKENRAIEFYEVLSSLRFLPSEKLLRTSGRSHVILSQIAADADEKEITSRPVGHLNLGPMMRGDILDELLLYSTVNTAVRLLDNAIDIGTYHIAREHRDIAIGIVGFAAAPQIAERCTESVAFYATLASTALAAQRGMYPSHSDSNWSIDVLPFESMKYLHAERVGSQETRGAKDWLAVRTAVRRHGMRNSHLLALTPAPMAEKLVDNGTPQTSFATELDQLVRCRKWIDGPVFITLPDYLSGPDLEQACVLAQQLGIRPFAPTAKQASDSNVLTDVAAATKVLKSIEKS